MSVLTSTSPGGNASEQPASPRRGNRTQASPLEKTIRYGLMLVAVAAVILPLLWQLSVSLRSAGESAVSFPANLIPENPTLDNYVTALTSIPLPQYFVNSAIISSMSVIINLVLATLTGYAALRGSW